MGKYRCIPRQVNGLPSTAPLPPGPEGHRDVGAGSSVTMQPNDPWDLEGPFSSGRLEACIVAKDSAFGSTSRLKCYRAVRKSPADFSEALETMPKPLNLNSN